MGTPPDRVFTTGAPGLDGLLDGPPPDSAALADLGLPQGHPFALATWHPATAADEDPVAGLSALLAALDARPDLAVLFTYPNADAGGRAIIAALAPWAAARAPRVRAVPSLGHARYRAALAHAALVIGNSSSGLIEAPAFGLPTVNIGDRQKGRLAAPSVLHAPAETDAILAALDTALSPAHRALAARRVSPYGQGNAAAAIHAILRDRPIPRDLPFHDKGPA
jgi:UDP-N-acetylglucosamine 2-epimerase (non-hydrolysing)